MNSTTLHELPPVPAACGGVDTDDIVVGSSKHITWEGFGLHIPSSPHTELLFDGVNPD